MKTRCVSSNGAESLRMLRNRSNSKLPFTAASADSDEIVTEFTKGEEEDEVNSRLVDSEMNSRPRRIALFVEPSPFS